MSKPIHIPDEEYMISHRQPFAVCKWLSVFILKLVNPMIMTAQKKMMHSTIIERFNVFRDTIKLSFKLDIGSYLNTAGVTYNGAELFEDVAKPVVKY